MTDLRSPGEAPSPRPLRRRRRATSLVEVMVASGIMAAALVPISWYFVSSARQQHDLEAEAAAAAYAAKVMNQLLDGEAYDDVTDALGGEEDVDGVMVRWSLEAQDVGDADFTFVALDGTEQTETLSILDAKNSSWIKDLRVTIQWRGPQHDDWDTEVRTQVLTTRRTRL